jgi:hypothetical protein
MSTECDRVADQLYRMVEGDAWHGPPVRALLADVSAVTAAHRPVPLAHSMWELVLHMTAWANAARRQLAGEIVELTPHEDWAPVDDTTPDAWARAVSELERAHAELRRACFALGDAHLEDRVPGRPFSVYVLLHGIVQHTAYHAGQIAILKRAGPHPDSP